MPNGPYEIRKTFPSASLVGLPSPPAPETVPRWPTAAARGRLEIHIGLKQASKTSGKHGRVCPLSTRRGTVSGAGGLGSLYKEEHGGVLCMDAAKRLRMCVLVDAARRETLESEIKSAGQWKMHLLSTN